MNQEDENRKWFRKWFDKQLRYNCSDNSGDVYTLRSEHYGNRNYVGDFPPYRYVWPLREPYYPDYTYPRTYTYGWETKTYTSDSMNDDIKCGLIRKICRQRYVCYVTAVSSFIRRIRFGVSAVMLRMPKP